MNEKEIREKISEGYIHFRAIIEVLGKPKEHVKKSLDQYIDKIRKNSELVVLKSEVEKRKKQEESELFLAFCEMEILAKDAQEIMNFCFDYMPSSIEVIEPEEFTYRAFDFTGFLNDVQARLHAVNMAMQELNQKNINLLTNSATLIRNFVKSMLASPKSVSDLNASTGIKEEELNKLLDVMIKEGAIIKKGDMFLLRKNA